jgi:hypothetical protein
LGGEVSGISTYKEHEDIGEVQESKYAGGWRLFPQSIGLEVKTERGV